MDAIVLMDIAVSYLRANIPKNTVVRSMPTRVAQSVGVNPLETEVLLAVNSLEDAVAREYFEKMVQIAGGGRGRHRYGGRSHVHERYHKNAAQPCSLQSDVGQLIRNRTAGFYGRGQRACPPPGRRCKSGGQRERTLRMFGVTDKQFISTCLHDAVSTNMLEKLPLTPYCTDSGDVSWQAPMCQCFVAGQPIGSTNHSWQQVVASGSGIGHKALLAAGKYLAMTAMNILTDPRLLAEARAEYEDAFKKHPYICPLPPHALPGRPYTLAP